MEGIFVKLKDFFDTQYLNSILSDWSKATGLAVIALDDEGNYISDEFGMTDFCQRYTKGTKEGSKRCERCDRENTGVYYCHAGLIDFSTDIKVGDVCVGKIVGGQVLPNQPDEEKFSRLAREIGAGEKEFLEALKKVPVRTEEEIKAAAHLLGETINMLVNFEYKGKTEKARIERLEKDIEKSVVCIEEMNGQSKQLDKIREQQKILALNASIEAARAGEAGKGFAIVASKVGDLANNSGKVNDMLKKTLVTLNQVVDDMEDVK
jgi:ligand-binding sensor protein